MPAFMLIMSVIIGDPETGPRHDFVMDGGLTREDCAAALESYRPLWLGNDSVGMHCEESGE